MHLFRLRPSLASTTVLLLVKGDLIAPALIPEATARNAFK